MELMAYAWALEPAVKVIAMALSRTLCPVRTIHTTKVGEERQRGSKKI